MPETLPKSAYNEALPATELGAEQQLEAPSPVQTHLGESAPEPEPTISVDNARQRVAESYFAPEASIEQAAKHSWAADPEAIAQAEAYNKVLEEKRRQREAGTDALNNLTKEDWARLESERKRREEEAAEKARTPIMPEAPEPARELLELAQPIKDFDNLKEVAEALVATPMISHDLIYEHTVAEEGETHYREDVTVPMSRIVGIGTFETWAGRGFQRESDGIIDKDGESSLTEVARCGRLGQIEEYLGVGAAPKLRLFEDADGEIWAYAYSDGSHRTAGAKARGDQYLRHAIVDYTDRPARVDFSVAQMLQEIKQSGLVGREQASVADYVDSYVAASEAFDATSPTAQRAKQDRTELERARELVNQAHASANDNWEEDWA